MAGRWLIRIALVWVACLWLTGCGYHFAGEGSGPKPGMQKIAIPVFENKSSEAELETLFAGALRHEFMVRGTFQVVSTNEAEAVFRGRIIRLMTTELAHQRRIKPSRARLFITVDVRCVDTKTGAVLWQDNNLTQYSNFCRIPTPLWPGRTVVAPGRLLPEEWRNASMIAS